MEIQQSDVYATYIRNLGWIVEKVNNQYVYIKIFPFIGSLAKIQRGIKLPSIRKLVPILKKYRVKTLAIEPDSSVPQTKFTTWTKTAKKYVRLNTDSFLPTKTVRIPLSPSLEGIFRHFSEAKRRAVRRAEKNDIRITVSDDIDALIHLKNKTAGFLGSITTMGVKKLWNVLPDANKAVLLAYCPDEKAPIACILLFYWDHLAYYWIAGATKKGKKLFAPTLLVWKAIEEAKKNRCTDLDFIGVWDERSPTKNHLWKGFTKFKEGFGGEALYYPIIRL